MTAQRLVPAGIVLFFLGLYGLTFHGYVDFEDTEVCYQSVIHWLDHGSFAIGDTDIGRRLTAAGFFVVQAGGGQWFPVYPLLQLLLHVPGAMLGRALSGLAHDQPDEVVRFVFTALDALTAALVCGIVHGIGRQLGQSVRVAAVAALLTGSCTMLWVAAQGTLVDPTLALFTSASVLCLLRAGRSSDSARRPLGFLVLAGLLHGLAVELRPSALLLLLPSAWFLRGGRARDLAAFLVPVGLTMFAFAWLDADVFARPPGTGYAAWAQTHPPVLTPSYSLSLLGLVLSDGRGLFMLSPVLLLAVLAWPATRRAAPGPAWLIAGQLGVLVLFFAAFDGWHGGWCWGPRYLLPVVPLLGALAGCWLARRGWRARALTVLLAAASLGIQVLSVAVTHRIYLAVATTSDASLEHFIFYSRCSPVLVHARILAKKVRGEPDVYTARELFGRDDDRPFAVAEIPPVEISRYSAGFMHFAWVRVFAKDHAALAVLAVASCSVLMGVGLFVALRASGPSADPRA